MGLFDNLFKSRKDKILEKKLMETDLGVKFYQGWTEIGYSINNIVYRGRFGSYNCREVGRFDDSGYVYSGYKKIGRVERNNIYLNREIIGKVKGKYCVSSTNVELFKADKENVYAIGAALLLLFDIQPKEKIKAIDNNYNTIDKITDQTKNDLTSKEIAQTLIEKGNFCVEEELQVSCADNTEEYYQSKTIKELRNSKDWFHLTRELITESCDLSKNLKLEYLFAAFFLDVSGIDERAFVQTIDDLDTGNYLMKHIKDAIKEYDLSDIDIISIFKSSKLIKELSNELQFYYFDINNCAKLLTILYKEEGPLYLVADKGIEYNVPVTNANNYTYFDD